MLETKTENLKFSEQFKDRVYDFSLTGASNQDALVFNIGFDKNATTRAQFPRGLSIDRHAGEFELSDELSDAMWAQRSMWMRVLTVPGALLRGCFTMCRGLLGMGPKTIAIGSSETALMFNVVMLAILLCILFVVFTVGLYVIVPLIVVSIISYLLRVYVFEPELKAERDDFFERIAGHVEHLVEDTVHY